MDRTGRGADMRLTFGFLAIAALAACQVAPGTGAELSTAVEGGAPSPATLAHRVIERDVEAPEVFQRQEPGLWDGRPSLGGVWVAHPGATDPERVVIRNTGTGASVIGALFRRERDNPGPRFQISSEAASALGILAGAPSDISVTALRLQRVEMEIAPSPAATTAAAETLAVAPAVATPTAAPATGSASAPTDQVAVSDVDPAPRRGLRDLFRRREPDAGVALIASTPLAPVADAATATAATTASATQTMTEMTSAEAPQPRRRLLDLFRRQEPQAPDTTAIPLPDIAAAPASSPASATPPANSGSRVERPLVQIGIFSVEANAENARGMMQRAGLSAEIRRGRAGENLFWRVVVGPATSVADRERILARVRGLGFADAYAVAR